jgi:hypothetical protein
MEDPQLPGAARVELALSGFWLGLDPGSVFLAPLLCEGVRRTHPRETTMRTRNLWRREDHDGR